MGQAMRMMKYDGAANEVNAVSALEMAGKPLKWHRLDDGVMGGQSETNHVSSNNGVLQFCGTINTDGGGFTSIRTFIPKSVFTSSTEGVKIRFRGDGKTYKYILSDGNRSTGGPFGRNPSWQANLPTKKAEEGTEDWEEAVIPFASLLPSFGGGGMRSGGGEFRFDATEMKEMGLMLSLKLSDGSPNPKETFGEGIFPFSLEVQSIEPVQEQSTPTS